MQLVGMDALLEMLDLLGSDFIDRLATNRCK